MDEQIRRRRGCRRRFPRQPPRRGTPAPRAAAAPSSQPSSGAIALRDPLSDVRRREHRARRQQARAACGAAARRRRCAPARGARRGRASASRSGGPSSTIGCASSPRSAATREHVARARGRSGRRGARRRPRARPRRAAARRPRPPARAGSRAFGRARRGLALDDPVDGHLRHPPPRRQLAAGDRDHPAGGLVELGLARDVDGLLRVAGRDQRPHAGVGAGDVATRSATCRRTRWSRRAGTRCRRRPAGCGRGRSLS